MIIICGITKYSIVWSTPAFQTNKKYISFSKSVIISGISTIRYWDRVICKINRNIRYCFFINFTTSSWYRNCTTNTIIFIKSGLRNISWCRWIESSSGNWSSVSCFIVITKLIIKIISLCTFKFNCASCFCYFTIIPIRTRRIASI